MNVQSAGQIAVCVMNIPMTYRLYDPPPQSFLSFYPPFPLFLRMALSVLPLTSFVSCESCHVQKEKICWTALILLLWFFHLPQPHPSLCCSHPARCFELRQRIVWCRGEEVGREARGEWCSHQDLRKRPGVRPWTERHCREASKNLYLPSLLFFLGLLIKF